MIVDNSKKSEREVTRIRNPSKYEDLSGRFRLLVRTYDKQFANIYTVRIIEARKKIEKIASRKWGI